MRIKHIVINNQTMSFKTRSSNVFAASSVPGKNSAPVIKVDPHYDNLGIREPHEIVGSPEWAYMQNLKEIQRTGVVREFTPFVSNTHVFEKMKYTQPQLNAERELVNNILDFTNTHDWAQIEGGEHNKKWLTSKYPDKLFETGKILEHISGETHYFPVADMENDPLGIAMHYQISPGGSTYTINHNGFTPYGNSRDRSYWSYRTKRRNRLNKQNEYNKAMERVAALEKLENNDNDIEMNN